MKETITAQGSYEEKMIKCFMAAWRLADSSVLSIYLLLVLHLSNRFRKMGKSVFLTLMSRVSRKSKNRISLHSICLFRLPLWQNSKHG
jgi:hypothetical protein